VDFFLELKERIYPRIRKSYDLCVVSIQWLIIFSANLVLR